MKKDNPKEETENNVISVYDKVLLSKYNPKKAPKKPNFNELNKNSYVNGHLQQYKIEVKKGESLANANQDSLKSLEIRKNIVNPKVVSLEEYKKKINREPINRYAKDASKTRKNKKTFIK